VCELLGFPSGELGPAVIFASVPNLGDYYENAYLRSDSLLTGSSTFDRCLAQLLLFREFKAVSVKA
jgi:hypothetical protein